MDLFSFNFLEPEAVPAPTKKAPQHEERVLTVGQLLRETRETLEQKFTRIWVKGEISNFKAHPSGHQYFTLKDAQAQISCVIWRSQVSSQKLKLRDGMEVQACGDVTVYEARGQLQMTVRKVQQSGLGALQLRFEELKQRLAGEGLFDPARKVKLPEFPETIAIVTAASGAALRDMLHVMERRAPWIRVLVYSVPVQGADAHHHIAKAIRFLSQKQPGLPDIDVLVVARGGGSLEDLWSFNEESVARALADCPLPTVSAVGHEVDFTIADFVADLRAPTPSAAAELIAPDRAEIAVTLSRWNQSFHFRTRQVLQHHNRVLALMGAGQLDRIMEHTLANSQQAIDEMDATIHAHVRQRLQTLQSQLQTLRFQIGQHSPAAELSRLRAALTFLAEKLHTHVTHRLTSTKQHLSHLQHVLLSLSPDATMARGYSLTTDAKGRPVTSIKSLHPGQEIVTRLTDGTIRSKVT